MALLISLMPAAGLAHYAAGMAIGCLLAKGITEAVMAVGYSRLAGKMARKLGVRGALVGLAPGAEPRLFGGHRFRDAGFLWFEAGKLCYRSERTTIELGSLDVVELALIPAAPAAWLQLQPMIQFRAGESAGLQSFILHPLDPGSTGKRLFGRIERWRAAAAPAAGSALVHGFEDAPGEPIRPVTLGQLARGFQLSGGAALIGAMLAGWPTRPEMSGWYALGVAAGAYASLLLPMALYRPQTRATALTTPLQ